MKRLVEKLAPMPFWQQTFYLMVLAAAVTTAVAVPLFTIGMIFDALRGPLVFLGFMAVVVIIITVDNRAHNEGIRRQCVLEAAPMVLFKVVCDAAAQLEVLTPSNVEETRCHQMDRSIQSAPVLCFELYKKKVDTILDRHTLLKHKGIWRS